MRRHVHTPDGVWLILSRATMGGSMKAFVTVIAILVSTFLFSAESSAKVFIYKGTLRIRSAPVGDLPKSSTTFLLIDPDLSQVASIALIRGDGTKLMLVASPTEIRFATCDLADGKTASVLSSGNVVGSSNLTFQNSIEYFRGTNATLRFSSASFGNVQNFPRLLIGSTLSASSFSGEGQFVESRIVAAFQSVRTIAANDANLTLQQAVDDLVVDLNAQGFEAP
jgi:hypothetical protein